MIGVIKGYTRSLDFGSFGANTLKGCGRHYMNKSSYVPIIAC